MASGVAKSPKAPPSTTLGFCGLGAMGAPMAANLVRKGFALRVWNRSPGPVAKLVELGATAATSPADCARGAAAVITMVSDKHALAAILGGDFGVLAGLAKRAIVVDMSTIGRAAALEAARAVEAVGGRFVDAPVSGSVRPAVKGELLALVGGRVKDVGKIDEVLRAMCSRVLFAGDVGQGQALKVVLNGLGAHHFVGFTSMLVLGERAGLRRETVVEAFTTGAFATPSYIGKRAKVLARDYSPEFSLDLALRDCAATVELQREVGLPLASHRECMREIQDAVGEGLGKEDLFALEKHFTARRGV